MDGATEDVMLGKTIVLFIKGCSTSLRQVSIRFIQET